MFNLNGSEKRIKLLYLYYFFLVEFMLKLLSQDLNENIRIKYSMFV